MTWSHVQMLYAAQERDRALDTLMSLNVLTTAIGAALDDKQKRGQKRLKEFASTLQDIARGGKQPGDRKRARQTAAAMIKGFVGGAK